MYIMINKYHTQSYMKGYQMDYCKCNLFALFETHCPVAEIEIILCAWYRNTNAVFLFKGISARLINWVPNCIS